MYPVDALTVSDVRYLDDTTPDAAPQAIDEALFDYTARDDGAVVTGYRGGSVAELEIPESLGGLPVVEIGAGAFSGREDPHVAAEARAAGRC